MNRDALAVGLKTYRSLPELEAPVVDAEDRPTSYQALGKLHLAAR